MADFLAETCSLILSEHNVVLTDYNILNYTF
jgi:hypothetical protein